ncbi:TPA: BppU family phage baseplate upper protein [Clostridium perfringens]|nr:BppU family phage baseplate upper protein [Clostridium perfringens]
MSEIGLNINVDSYNNEGIKTIKGNNNAEIYKLYILKNKRRLNLVGKTVKLGYVMAGTTKGDIIEDLNITNAEQGEITLPITNIISKQDGVYSCQLAIYGADEFLEYTATFGLTVKANIFTKIAGEIENSKDLTYIERILEEATNISEELKSNIPVARQLNSDLENQNRILNENMDRANGVNNTLITTTEQSKVAATDAIEKKGQLEKSITKAKEFIDGLDGSQNIPQIRMDVTELQNGLKSNQSLSYEGSSIAANNTLEGRTEGMRIVGRTLQNACPKFTSNNGFGNIVVSENILEATGSDTSHTQFYFNKDNIGLFKPNTTYTIITKIIENTLTGKLQVVNGSQPFISKNAIEVPEGYVGDFVDIFTTKEDFAITSHYFGLIVPRGVLGKVKLSSYLILEGDWRNKQIPHYFEGIKSFGESEGNKISILSCGLNIVDISKWSKKETIDNKQCWVGDGYLSEGVKNGEPIVLNLATPVKKGDTVTLVSSNKATQYFNRFQLFNSVTNKVQTIGTNSTLNYWTTSNFSTTSDSEYDSIQINTGGIGAKSYIETLFIGIGSALNYKSYKQDKKDILIKEPLKSVGDIKDIIYEDDGKVKIDRYVGKIIINGNSDDGNNYIYYSDKRFIINIRELNINKKDRAYVLCDKLPYNYSAYSTIGQYGISGYGDSSASFVGRWDFGKTVTDRATFIEYLKTNPITIYYELDTPVTEVVENCVDIDLDTYQEKTYFNILNSLPGTLDFKVPSNIGSSLQNLAKEVNNIWDVINNLLVPSIVKANGNLAMLKLNNNLN